MAPRQVPLANLLAAIKPVLSAANTAPRWFVALSGGVDSAALLALLAHYHRQHTLSLPLAAVHVDHGLHPDSSRWADSCRALCDSLQLPLQVHAVAVDERGEGREAAARRARYLVFEEVLGPGDLLFTGHHLDDQVETFFLRALRGAGVEGLAAIPARRRLGRGELLRPLLGICRSELQEVVAALGLGTIEDPSNFDTSLDRNYLRQQVLPLLAQRWPAYRTTVGRAAQHLADAAQLIRESTPMLAGTSNSMGDTGFYLDGLLRRAEADRAVGLRHWLQAQGVQMPDSKALAEFLRQLVAGGAQARLDAGDWCLQRYGESVYLHSRQGLPEPGRWALAPGQSLTLRGVGQVALQPSDTGGFLLPATGVVELRLRRGGERCRLPGREHSSSVKRLLQEAGIPPWWRKRLPLVYSGDTLLAVADLVDCQDPPEPAVDAPRWRLQWLREAACD